MTRDPISGIRILAREVDYSDGAEDRLLEIISSATDLNSLSDELAARIDDWPTRYHLARERSNLLRPLAIDNGLRVLEIGAGTGAVSRFLGETGARVVALEGSLPRAQAAAARCRDLDNVEVVCGALDAFEDADGFDLVCLIGVLEYAGAERENPADFLRSAAAHLRPNGTLVVAIENQIGLKYLVGYDEDHLGRPWVGIEGYLDDDGVRTYTRRRLKGLLEDAGLGFQRWLYPFPDYKMASVIVSQSAYDEHDAVDFIDQVVRTPLGGGGNTSQPLLCDDRRVHRVILEAGLGPEVANSFLVLASAGPGDHPGEPDAQTVAWLYGGQRQRRWIRHQVVESLAGGRRIRADGPGDLYSPRKDGWLEQNPRNDQRFVIGTTIWEQATSVCRNRDAQALRGVIELWRRAIDRERSEAGAYESTNPFLLTDTREVLPPDHLDICLSNFVVSDKGIAFVDREWIAAPAVDADLVSVRGLWLLAQGLVRGGGIHPWDPGLTVDELTIELGRLVGLPAAEHLDHLYQAESEFMQRVSGRARESIVADFEWLRTQRPTDPEAIRSFPVSRLRDQLDAIRAELADLGTERRERARLEDEVAHERRAAAGLATELGATHDRLAEVGAKLESLAGEFHRATGEITVLGERAKEADALKQRVEALTVEIDDKDRTVVDLTAERDSLVKWREAFERKTLVRLWRRLQRLFGSRH